MFECFFLLHPLPVRKKIIKKHDFSHCNFFFEFEHTIFFATTKYRNVRMRPLNNLLDFLSLFFSWQLKLQTATIYFLESTIFSRKISQNFSLYVASNDHESKFVLGRKKSVLCMYVFSYNLNDCKCTR